MTRFRFITKRKSESIILWLIAIISIFLIIKTSDDPILPFLQGTSFENVVNQFNFGNSIIQTLSLSFLISLIFYLIVVHLPMKRKQMDLNPYIKDQCESIIFSSYILINDIISKSDTSYNYENLTTEQFNEICEKVNPKEHKSKFHNGFGNHFEHHLGYKIYNSWTRIENEIENLFRLLPYIESGLLKKMNILKNNFLKYSAKDLSQMEKLRNENLSAWSDTLYTFYIQTKDLRDYCYLFFNEKLKNDPWDK